MKGFALALGGGGARGFAHLGVLQELEEENLVPSGLAGTSMGAIVAALYACGQDLQRISKILAALDLSEFFGFPDSYEKLVEQVARESLAEKLHHRPWWEVNSPRTSRVLAFLRLFTKGKRFEELALPLVVVACDVMSGEEIRIREGPVYIGAGASAALPGLLGPVRWRGRWLIDGGAVNNLPADVAAEYADTVVAVDVSAPLSSGISSTLDLFLRVYEITSRALVAARLERLRDILGERLLIVRPELEGIGLLDFHKLPQALEAGRAAARPLVLELRNRV